ncbi:MAG: PEP-utilizing enzyme [Candidatus Paceibacterota bacterium]|jgi:phosphohistidine swiveling domain-containing protein
MKNTRKIKISEGDYKTLTNTISGQEIGTLASEKWFKVLKRLNSPLFDSLIRVGCVSDREDFGLKNKMDKIMTLNYDVYSQEENADKIKVLFEKKCREDYRYLDKLFSGLYKECKLFDTWADKTSKIDFSVMCDKKLLKYYEKYLNFSFNVLVYLWPPLLAEDGLIRIITEELSKVYNPINNYEELQESLRLLTSSETISTIQEKEESLIKLAIKISTFVDVQSLNENLSGVKDNQIKIIKNVYEKYAWIPDAELRFNYESFADFINNLKKVLGENPQKKLNEIEEAKKRLIKAKKQIIKEAGLNKVVITYAHQASDLAHIRLLRVEKLEEVCYKVQNLFYEIGKRAGLDNHKKICLFNFWEITDFLLGEKINLNKILERSGGYAVIYTKDTIYELDIAIGEKIKEIIEKKTERVDTFKGNIACKGLVKGIVKVLHSANEIGKLEAGEILVTSMTMPNYVPAMKIAGAIITDEGGISCHAAIVSRELGIPCIIGTKIATKVLKDGDLVEVDADKGIVRIIKD